MKITFAIVVLFAVVKMGFAQELSNPPVPHDADARGKEAQRGATQKEQETGPTSPPAFTMKQDDSHKTAGEGGCVGKNPKEDGLWPPSPAWAAVYIAGVSAFATIIYAIISGFQWWAIRSQNRSWIMVTPDVPNPIEEDFEGFPLRLTIKNVGKSPAILTKIAIEVGVKSFPVPKGRLRYGKTDPGAVRMLAPDETYERWMDVPFGSDIEDVRNGRKYLVLFGYIKYRDMRWTYRRTRFLYWWYRKEGKHWTGFFLGPRGAVSYT